MNNPINIENLIADIIPPDDYEHRNGFSNKRIIDKLNNQEMVLVEEALIDKLLSKPDMLIVETLAYMKSVKSLPILNNLLDQCSNAMCKIIIATSLFEIKQDPKMVAVCTEAFKNISDSYEKITAFYYLVKLKNPITDEIVESYTSHMEYLLSYNAKKALGR